MRRKILTVLFVAVAGGGCKPENVFIPMIDGSIAITAGDFDDVKKPFDRMVVNTETYEGLISSATWDDEYDPASNSLKVEDLIGSGGGITAHQLIVFASGTRGLGLRQYNGLEPDDEFVGDENALAQVKAKVTARGIIVATDWAYDLTEQTCPDVVDYLGDDEVFDDAQRGEIGNVTATVEDPALAAAFEADTVLVRYDFSNWAVIEAADEDNAKVWLRGDIEYRERDGEGVQALTDVPLLVSYQPEGLTGGTVVVSTFHLDAQTPEVTDDILRVVVGNFDEAANEPLDPL